MTEDLGARAEDWSHFDLMLGLGGNLLPVVPTPDAKPAPNTKVKKFGKIPSQYNRDGEAFGLKDWASRSIMANEQALWSKDRRLGMCVRTGSISGLYAIDVDTESELNAAIMFKIYEHIPKATTRSRLNSPRALIPIFIEGMPALDKRIVKLPGGPHDRIEFLADGQEFVACGTHPSGARYAWAPSVGDQGYLPPDFTQISFADFEKLWKDLEQFGEVMPNARPVVPTNESTSGTDDKSGAASDEQHALLTSVDAAELPRLLDALSNKKLTALGGDQDTWSEIGYALLTLKEQGKKIFCQWSRTAPNYEAGAPEDWWGAHEHAQTRTDYRHIYNLARVQGWGRSVDTDAFEPVRDTLATDVQPTDERDGGSNDTAVQPDPVPAVPGKTILFIKGDEFKEQIEKAALELAKLDRAFISGFRLSMIGSPSDLNDGMVRGEDAKAIMPISAAYMKGELGHIMDIRQFDGRSKEWLNRGCPKDFAEAMVSYGRWPHIKPIHALARSPFMRIDGSVCDKPGYDDASGVYYTPNAVYPPLPAVISKDDAHAALARLRDPFREFPHSNDVQGSESAFISHILTEAARMALECSPMFWYSAPDASAGKTLLCRMPATIVHGTQPSQRPWVMNAEELRKTLFASLLVGDRSILFDNVQRGQQVRGSELCAFLTSPIWADRKLGASETHKLVNTIVLSATGINIMPIGELARRSIAVRLGNADKTRVFKIPALSHWVRDHRVSLLMDALTILVGWRQHKGEIKTPPPLPSFEDWSDIVRDALLWLGMIDPAETQVEETDDEHGGLDAAFELLGKTLAGEEFLVARIITLSQSFTDTDGRVAKVLHSAGCGDPESPFKVGYWLKDNRDRMAGGYKLLRIGTGSGARWKFKNLHETAEDLL